ncbi:hypothetical protein [uncultured Polaribacter sp.]|uniref:hypothetical protein n=1 Tax=uncultured Polaribacter sp. TaxID=174711 RepID=UPI0026058DED|nr:hypothetical protein [uncultured Polaribacter sp.]
MTHKNTFINKAKTELSKTTFELFNSVNKNITNKIDFKNIKISSDFEKDYIRIELDSDSNGKLKFRIEFFKGLSDFFIDDGIEIFIQKKFPSSAKSKSYFKQFLTGSIRKDIYLSKEKITKTDYYLINNSSEKLIYGEINIIDIFRTKRSKKSILFAPWITE